MSRNVYEAALGYFIYPLVAVMFGIALLGEKLDQWGWAAIGIVASGVLVKAQLIAGVLDCPDPCCSFALYGVVRKRLGVNPVLGMFIETVILIPPAILYLLWIYMTGGPVFFGGGAVNTILAMLPGSSRWCRCCCIMPATAICQWLPVCCFTPIHNPDADWHLYFQVPFPPSEAVTFGLIWCGLALYFLSRRPMGKQPESGSVDNFSADDLVGLAGVSPV